jgi:alkylhydroperoxidase family enzyme
MRLSEPRIEPLADDQWTDEAAKVMAPIVEAGPPLNIFRTLVHHPGLMRRWMVFANHVLGKSTLPARERELVILRIGYLCRAGYEWGQHVGIAREVGLTDDEIRRIQLGPESAEWSDLDRALLRATDELHADSFISDATWSELTGHLSTEQVMDVVFAVGQYNLVSMALNSFGVQPEPGLPGWQI